MLFALPPVCEVLLWLLGSLDLAPPSVCSSLPSHLVESAPTPLHEYDESLARLNVYACWATYAPDPDTVISHTCGHACDMLQQNKFLSSQVKIINGGEFSSQELLALVGKNGEEEKDGTVVNKNNKEDNNNNNCVLAFRGSEQFLDFMNDDFNAITISPYPRSECSGGTGFTQGCSIHKGFYDAWHQLKQGVLRNLKEIGCYEKGRKLHITGHSLGAAMAFVAAFELSQEIPLHSVYTFGQPRVGDSDLIKEFQNRMRANNIPYFRITQYKDPIPHLPPLHLFLPEDYRHAGPEIWYTSSDRNLVGPNITDPSMTAKYRVRCEDGEDAENCSSQYNMVDTLMGHVCDHCAYLGMNICFKVDGPDREDPQAPYCVEGKGEDSLFSEKVLVKTEEEKKKILNAPRLRHPLLKEPSSTEQQFYM